MSHYTCPECGQSGRDEVIHKPQCSSATVSLEDRLRDIEERLDALENRESESDP